MNRDDLDDTIETEQTPTRAERIIERYPSHNWSVQDGDTLRLEAGDAHIEAVAYSYETKGGGEEIRCDLEISHPRGGEITMSDVNFDDLPEAIGQGLVALHAQDVFRTGESDNVDAETIPGWAAAAFAEQAALVSDRLTETAYLKTLDPDAYALRYVRAERKRQIKKWGSDHDDEHNEPVPALAAAAWWLTLPTAANEPAPARVPTWAVELKNQIAEQWPDVGAAHEICCIKAAALLLAEIARCRRARMKAEKAARAAARAAAEEKAQP